MVFCLIGFLFFLPICLLPLTPGSIFPERGLQPFPEGRDPPGAGRPLSSTRLDFHVPAIIMLFSRKARSCAFSFPALAGKMGKFPEIGRRAESGKRKAGDSGFPGDKIYLRAGLASLHQCVFSISVSSAEKIRKARGVRKSGRVRRNARAVPGRIFPWSGGFEKGTFPACLRPLRRTCLPDR